MTFENNYGITSIDTNNASIAFANPLSIKGCRFEKVSFDQFFRICVDLESKGQAFFGGEDIIRSYYDEIKLPARATPDSAGYDFYMPFPEVFTQHNNQTVLIPTGIRVLLNPGTFLMCVPRSGLGFKYGMRLRNSTGIIDADYACSDNEGHIMAKISTEETFKLDVGDRFMQGIILPFFITEDDEPISDKRNGGFGSTGGAGQ